MRFQTIRSESFLMVSLTTSLAFLFAGETLLAGLDNSAWRAFVLAWLFVVILGSALAVVRHADHLAERLGEPYGTLILTLSITTIEVSSIASIMLHGGPNPTLARDTLLAVVMIILNGMVGVSLLLGAWRHREQSYNLQGASVYLSAIIPLVVLSLVLPNFTQTTAGPTFSTAQQVFLVLVTVGLYVVFLVMQTGRHSGYFVFKKATVVEAAGHGTVPLLVHAGLLMAFLLPIVFLAEQLARPVDYYIERLNAPAALAGIVIAVLVVLPEGVGAVRSALANDLQRAINISLGSVLATIGLTVPALIIVTQVTGGTIVLGVAHADLVMLLLTLGVSIVTFASGRTNIIQGIVHLILFAAYLMLIFQS